MRDGSVWYLPCSLEELRHQESEYILKVETLGFTDGLVKCCLQGLGLNNGVSNGAT